MTRRATGHPLIGLVQHAVIGVPVFVTFWGVLFVVTSDWQPPILMEILALFLIPVTWVVAVVIHHKLKKMDNFWESGY